MIRFTSLVCYHFSIRSPREPGAPRLRPSSPPLHRGDAWWPQSWDVESSNDWTENYWNVGTSHAVRQFWWYHFWIVQQSFERENLNKTNQNKPNKPHTKQISALDFQLHCLQLSSSHLSHRAVSRPPTSSNLISATYSDSGSTSQGVTGLPWWPPEP